MARLLISVDIDVDPTLEDPDEVALDVISNDDLDQIPVFVTAEWVVED